MRAVCNGLIARDVYSDDSALVKTCCSQLIQNIRQRLTGFSILHTGRVISTNVTHSYRDVLSVAAASLQEKR